MIMIIPSIIIYLFFGRILLNLIKIGDQLNNSPQLVSQVNSIKDSWRVDLVTGGELSTAERTKMVILADFVNH